MRKRAPTVGSWSRHLGGRAEKAAQGGRLERMSEERVVRDSVRRFRLYEMLWRGVGGLQLRTRGREKDSSLFLMV